MRILLAILALAVGAQAAAAQHRTARLDEDTLRQGATIVTAQSSTQAPRHRTVRVDENTPRQRAPIVNDQTTVQAGRLELRGLDTLNGSVRDLSLAVGETLRYGHLEVTAEACRVPEADPEGDAYAFLRIRDIREHEPRFSGWMFASSPALSALDHPRYDVWVLSCSNR